MSIDAEDAQNSIDMEEVPTRGAMFYVCHPGHPTRQLQNRLRDQMHLQTEELVILTRSALLHEKSVFDAMS